MHMRALLLVFELGYSETRFHSVSNLAVIVMITRKLSYRKDDRAMRPIYTGWSKKTVPQFYFRDNFRKCTPIFTIFSLLEQEIHAA